MKCPYCIKICTKCKKILVAYNGNFAKQKIGKYGVTSRCKLCDKIYREKNFERISEMKKKCYEEKRDEYLEKNRIYREEHKEEKRIMDKNMNERYDTSRSAATTSIRKREVRPKKMFLPCLVLPFPVALRLFGVVVAISTNQICCITHASSSNTE